MANAIVPALIEAGGTIVKTVIDRYAEQKKIKAEGKWKLLLAGVGLLTAVIVAAPKALEAYHRHRDGSGRPRSENADATESD